MRKRNYENLLADVLKLQEQYPGKARLELFPQLRELGWNMKHYNKIFGDTSVSLSALDFKSFFGY
jgi:hypothetical protein